MAENVPDTYVRLREKSWLRRVFDVGGVVNAQLEYNALKAGVGYSNVSEDDNPARVEHHALLVNGAKVAGAQATSPLPTFAFPGTAQVRGHVEVLLSNKGLFVQIVWLRLTIAGGVIYEERDGKIMRIKVHPQLPLPAGAATDEDDTLPLPSNSGAEEPLGAVE